MTVEDAFPATNTKPHVGLILALTVNGLAISEYPQMVRVTQAAEEYGFDSVWVCDHFLTLSPADYVKDAGIHGDDDGHSAGPESMPLLEGWTTLSALARDTRRLRLGTSVLCNSYRHPAVLAKMAATLDVISGGRLELGIGAGWFQREFDAYGIPFPTAADRVSALAESIDVIKAVWTQHDPTFAGRFYRIEGAICDPPPVQRPHPPLWIGGEGQRVSRIAARGADGLNVRWWSPQRVKERRAFLTQACESAGRDPATLRLSLTALLAPTTSRAQEVEVRETFSAIPESGLIVGPPEECLQRIDEYRRCGVDHFLFTIPHIVESDYLHTVGHDVLPELAGPRKESSDAHRHKTSR